MDPELGRTHFDRSLVGERSGEAVLVGNLRFGRAIHYVAPVKLILQCVWEFCVGCLLGIVLVAVIGVAVYATYWS